MCVPKESRGQSTNKRFIVSAPCGAQSALPLTLMMPVLSTSSVGFVFRKNAYCAPGRSGQTTEAYVSPLLMVVTRVDV